MKRLAILLCLSVSILHPSSFAAAQPPNLVVSAGSTGQGPSLTVTSDSNSPWKCFTVSGSNGQYNVIWAESNGTTGGIYFGTIATSSSGSAGPVAPPAPSDLPIGTLTTAVSAAMTGVDAATAAAVANSYESVAEAVDAGTIVSPLQLKLATGAQLLALTSDQLTACSGFISAVNGWISTQESTSRLTPAHMDRYAKSYHAIAQAVKPGTVAPPAGSAKPPMAAAAPKLAPSGPAPAKSPRPAEAKSLLRDRQAPSGPCNCPGGKCPNAPQAMPELQGWWGRWRR